MNAPKEYTGQLIGGPDDGNFITASVPEFRATSRIILELDGPGQKPFIFDMGGKYVWDTEKLCFRWNPKESWHN